MTYTPGPWWVDGTDITTDDNQCLAVVRRPKIDDDGGYFTNDSVASNARLIARAPDLADLLQDCADWLGRYADCDAAKDCVRQARDLIRHVKGGE